MVAADSPAHVPMVAADLLRWLPWLRRQMLLCLRRLASSAHASGIAARAPSTHAHTPVVAAVSSVHMAPVVAADASAHAHPDVAVSSAHAIAAPSVTHAPCRVAVAPVPGMGKPVTSIAGTTTGPHSPSRSESSYGMEVYISSPITRDGRSSNSISPSNMCRTAWGLSCTVVI